MENKKLKRRSLIIDIIMLAVFLMVSIVSFYIAYSFGLLPIKWVTIAAAIFGLLFLILLLLAFKQIPTWGLVIKRLFLILLVAIVGTFGYFMEKSRTTINKMSKTTKVNDDGTTTITTNLYLITSKTSGIRSEAELADKIIGFQNGSDADNLSFAKTSAPILPKRKWIIRHSMIRWSREMYPQWQSLKPSTICRKQTSRILRKMYRF